MTHLERAIAESKKREEKATRGPFDAYFETGLTPMVVTYTEGKNGYRTLKDAIASGCKYQDAKFIAAARSWEPKWREMVEVMLKQFRGIDAEYADQTQGTSETLGKIAIRACETLAELERLAKEGLGEK